MVGTEQGEAKETVDKSTECFFTQTKKLITHQHKTNKSTTTKNTPTTKQITHQQQTNNTPTKKITHTKNE